MSMMVPPNFDIIRAPRLICMEFIRFIAKYSTQVQQGRGSCSPATFGWRGVVVGPLLLCLLLVACKRPGGGGRRIDALVCPETLGSVSGAAGSVLLGAGWKWYSVCGDLKACIRSGSFPGFFSMQLIKISRNIQIYFCERKINW